MCFLHSLRNLTFRPYPSRSSRSARPHQSTRFRAPVFTFPSSCNPLNSLILSQYRLLSHLATGSTADVYRGKNVADGTEVAIKIAPVNQFLEVRAIIILLDADPAPPGIPALHSYGTATGRTFLVTQLLGPSLTDLLDLLGGRMGLKSVCMLAIQAISILQHVHSKGLIHGDINPGNILMGRGSPQDTKTVYLIDFEDARWYTDNTGVHLPETTGHRHGNFCYASSNAHEGLHLSRRDDLISLGYTLVKLARGSLPWEKNMSYLLDRREVVGRKKRVVEEFCSSLPVEFGVYLNKVHELAFAETPEYDGFKWLFETCLENMSEEHDCEFEWFGHPEFEKIRA